MEVEKCCTRSTPKVVKEKVSVGHVECTSCGVKGPTVTANTHDEVDVSATNAWNAVRKHCADGQSAPSNH